MIKEFNTMLLRLLCIFLLSFALMNYSDLQAASKKSEPIEKRKIHNKSAKNSTQSKNTKLISKRSAISIAKKTMKGKVLSARMMSSGSSKVYSVKMLVGDSRVRTVYVDGKSGRVIRVNQD